MNDEWFFYFNLLLGPIIHGMEHYSLMEQFNFFHPCVLLSVIILYWSLNLDLSFFASHMEHAQYFLILFYYSITEALLTSLWHFFNIMLKWVNTPLFAIYIHALWWLVCNIAAAWDPAVIITPKLCSSNELAQNMRCNWINYAWCSFGPGSVRKYM